jgi:hypothetical protein
VTAVKASYLTLLTEFVILNATWIYIYTVLAVYKIPYNNMTGPTGRTIVTDIPNNVLTLSVLLALSKVFGVYKGHLSQGATRHDFMRMSTRVVAPLTRNG